MAATGTACVLLLAICILSPFTAAGRPLPESATVSHLPAASNEAVLRQQEVPEVPRPLTERLIFDPNRGEEAKVEDYIANVYFGEVDLAQANPVLAAAGAAVS